VSDRLRTILAAAAFAAISLVVAVRTERNLIIPGQPAAELFGLQDFRDNFYYPSAALLDGRNPYDYADYRAHYPIDRPLPPYSPISLLLHLPLALLPFTAAMAADFLANLGLLVVLAILSLRGAGVRTEPWRVLLVAALLVLSRPGHMTLFIGQCSAVMAVACTAALVEGRRRPWLAAIGVAVACAKPSYGGPLGVLMLLRGDLRALLPGSALAAMLGLIGAIGPLRAAGGLPELLDSVRGSMDVVATDVTFHEPTSLIRLDPVSLVGRVLGRPPGSLIGAALAIVILGAAGFLMRRLAARGEPEPRAVSNSLGCLAILLATYHQPYDALILALPAAVLLLTPGPVTMRRVALTFLLLVPGVNYVATFTLLERFDLPRFAWLLISESNGMALILALALGMRMAWERAQRGFSP
jgi:hypothetical protein